MNIFIENKRQMLLIGLNSKNMINESTKKFILHVYVMYNM